MFEIMSKRTDRLLLTTTTGEPYQPVRLYYTISAKPFIANILRQLRCMEEDREGDRWGWFYRDEAASLTFGTPPTELPADREPVLLGVFSFPKKGGMTLAVRSCARAIEAARFFGPIFGPRVVARRARLVNRYFAAAELDGRDLGELDRHLDQNVTVFDPRVAEEKQQAYLVGAKTQEERRRAYERYHEDKRRERRDVPLVEDFPLAPEEETPDFMHLATTLRLRELRAFEHWNGNTHVILGDIIERLVEQFGSNPPGR
jgi:hypothetical protein